MKMNVYICRCNPSDPNTILWEERDTSDLRKTPMRSQTMKTSLNSDKQVKLGVKRKDNLVMDIQHTS